MLGPLKSVIARFYCMNFLTLCLRFSYTAIVPPSFCVEDEDETGLTLAYRSRRKGFVYYVVGQLKDVAKRFYDLEIGVDVIHIQVILIQVIHIHVIRIQFVHVPPVFCVLCFVSCVLRPIKHVIRLYIVTASMLFQLS